MRSKQKDNVCRCEYSVSWAESQSLPYDEIDFVENIQLEFCFKHSR